MIGSANDMQRQFYITEKPKQPGYFKHTLSKTWLHSPLKPSWGNEVLSAVQITLKFPQDEVGSLLLTVSDFTSCSALPSEHNVPILCAFQITDIQGD